MTSLHSDKIRKELSQLLANPNADRGKILELSLKYSELDQDSVRFSVDASHIIRLGRELVVKKETAVSELVKNAYDADATKITLSFENGELSGGRLIIDDNGHGMNRAQIINGFMRLSTTDKVREPYSPTFKRLRAGRKGIGRFATHRLGRKLTIITQTTSSKTAFKVEINWVDFEADHELILISNQIQEVKKTKKHGTTLIIGDLEDGWTHTSLERVYRYLVDLLQPFPISRTLTVDKKDPGFDVKIFRSVDGKKEEIASADKIIFEYALAEIDLKIDKNGLGKWSVRSKQLGIREKKTYPPSLPKINEVQFGLLKNINLKAYYYIYNGKDSSYLPKHINTLISGLSKDRSGIRVYRNGFRVLPYGEQNNDWLGLDAGSARRSFLPPYRNQNFFGFVELVDPDGQVFEETASREGLLDNQGFQELRNVVLYVLETAVTRIAEKRGKKVKPTSRFTAKDRLQKATKNLQRAVSELKESSQSPKSTNTNAEVVQLLQTTITSLEDASTSQAEETNILLDELSMLRVLASLGLSIGQFNHEIRHIFPALIADVNRLIELNPSGAARKTALSLESNIRSFRTYTSYFDKAISANARRETKIQDVAQIARSFWDIITPACKRRGIEFPEPSAQGYDLFTIPMHTSEWTSILFNLFTNSRKAIKRSGNSTGKMLVAVSKEKERIILEFADNGDGIPSENSERIFDAFFTTSHENKSDYDEDEDMLGAGLGLKIIKDIVTAYNGEIDVVDAPSGYSTCLRVEIPAATEEQVEEYGY